MQKFLSSGRKALNILFFLSFFLFFWLTVIFFSLTVDFNYVFLVKMIADLQSQGSPVANDGFS